MLKRKGAVVGLRYLYLFARPRFRLSWARDLIVLFFFSNLNTKSLHESCYNYCVRCSFRV